MVSDMLVQAGYFRARLNIPMFDKILGGMCWCITGSNVDVDVEFEDDMIMGQKIRLAERVVEAVRMMDCPTPISAPQISALDLKRCYEVLKWLIHKLGETRVER